MSCVRVLAVLASLFTAAPVAAQTPAFDVASVRPNKEGRGAGIRPLANGQLTANNASLEELLRRAYGLHESQLVGGPSWLRSERFDIVAKAASPPPGGVDDVLLMLRSLLVERFSLDVRAEKRDLPAYVLMHANAEQRLGRGLRRSAVDCAANAAPVTPNSAPVDADGWPPCGLALVRTLVTTAPEGTRTRTMMKQAGIGMREIATRMQNLAGRPVVDATGLTGLFDVEYEFDGSSGGSVGDSLFGDLFTAVREQLGLKLEPQRASVDVLVIASARRPSDN